MFDARVDIGRRCTAAKFKRWRAILVQRYLRPNAELAEPLGGTLQGLGAVPEQTMIDRSCKVAGEALFAWRAQQIDIGDHHALAFELPHHAEHQRGLAEPSRRDEHYVGRGAEVNRQACDLGVTPDKVLV